MDGIIIINKPQGITSNAVVQRIRKILNTKKVGHCGTLDPLATGVLPILVGQGTKISKYLVEHDKTYIATIKLGEKRDTADCEGKVIESKNVPCMDEESIRNTLSSFVGKQLQMPPMYSAIKVNGKKLYEYARNNEQVSIEPRPIEIYDIRLLNYNSERNLIKFEVKCSKGTYIRTLCENISEKLGTVGYMQELIRTRVNEYSLEESITIEELEMRKKNIPFISIEDTFLNKSAIYLNEKELKLFLNGVLLYREEKNDIYRVYYNSYFIGLGNVQDNKLKRDVVIIEEKLAQN